MLLGGVNVWVCWKKWRSKMEYGSPWARGTCTKVGNYCKKELLSYQQDNRYAQDEKTLEISFKCGPLDCVEFHINMDTYQKKNM